MDGATALYLAASRGRLRGMAMRTLARVYEFTAPPRFLKMRVFEVGGVGCGGWLLSEKVLRKLNG